MDKVIPESWFVQALWDPSAQYCITSLKVFGIKNQEKNT